jgi:hypothetical protein
MSHAPTTPPPVPRRRRYRWLRILALIVVLPVIAVLAWYVSLRISNTSAVRRLEAKVRQRGEPLTLTELAAMSPSIPDSENAAIPLLELWEKEEPARWAAFRENQRPLPERRNPEYDPNLPFLGSAARQIPLGKKLPEAQRAAAEAWLKKNVEHSAAVRGALQRPKSRFPVRITDGFAALLPHYVEVRDEARNFRLEALIASEDGDVDSALAALRHVRRLGDLLAGEPLLIAQLVNLSCQSLALDGAEELLTRQRLSPPHLLELKALLESMDVTNGWRPALVSERAFALSAISAEGPGLGAISHESDVSPADMQRGLWFLRAIGLAQADQRLMLETFERATALADQDTPEALREYAKLEAEVKRKARGFPPKIFSGLLLPALSKAALKFTAVEARRRAGLAAVAVERHRQAHAGQLPNSWVELVPAQFPGDPTDPFTGEPLKLKALPRGFVVYSVGADEEDDGGKTRSRSSSKGGSDETFTVAR